MSTTAPTTSRMTADDRRILDEMAAEAAVNREHNRAAMDEAGVPRPARRGFSVATDYNAHRIVSIERRDRERGAARWVVIVEWFPGASSFSRSGYVVGPRGAAHKAF